MEEMIINELTHEGLRRLRWVGDAELEERSFLYLAPPEALGHAQVTRGRDAALGLFWLELVYPVYEPYEFGIYGPGKFRRLMVVHTVYEKRVSECIALAGGAFWLRTGKRAMYAFARELPKGARVGMEVHGCLLMEAEWMPRHCVAAGGCDVA